MLGNKMNLGSLGYLIFRQTQIWRSLLMASEVFHDNCRVPKITNWAVLTCLWMVSSVVILRYNIYIYTWNATNLESLGKSMKAKQYQREDRSFFQHCLIMNCDKSGKLGAPHKELHDSCRVLFFHCFGHVKWIKWISRGHVTFMHLHAFDMSFSLDSVQGFNNGL